MIDMARSGEEMDAEILQIINEEAQSYFEGQKSVKDAAALIQNRVQTYVNENK